MSSPVSGIRAGVIAILPAALAMYPFGLLLGQQAVAKGLSPVEVLAMSSIVFAGSAQFLAIGLWTDPPALAALAAATLLINLRHVLMGASIADKIEHFGRWRLPGVFLMTDEQWAVAERQALSGPITPAFWFGAGVFLYLNWIALTGLGAVLGGFVAEPERFGFDFAFPAIFIALALGFWKGWRTAPVIGASAVVAILVHRALPGPWYVIAGALAGIAAAVVTAARTGDRRA